MRNQSKSLHGLANPHFAPHTFLAVFIDVWLTYPATRSPFCTSTTVSLLATPSCLYRRATLFARTPELWLALALEPSQVQGIGGCQICENICTAHKRETVVFPTPGFPVNIMWRIESSTFRPSWRRLISNDNCERPHNCQYI